MTSDACLQKYSIAVCLFLCLGYPATVQGKPQNGELEIFVDGKKYNSIKDYKQYRIIKMREDALKEESQDTDDQGGQKIGEIKKPQHNRRLCWRKKAAE